ncbi:hypothetical protein [Gordonia alkanivorans]|uniref:hypothetical protein n=1 Tax=Gordonia alkanivorans TaxID=84096 RepID=UPI0024B64747|nr:hypothetical protein [Gordonia alkanivorans]MDJ0006480.1 hypothetical protein [Gordonia alkanivorans]MDJ0492108.1 hypothetical protein [Gordonia alkanivorans]
MSEPRNIAAVVERVVNLAHDNPKHAATCSLAYGNKAPHIYGGEPNTMIAVVLELGAALERGLAWNVAPASTLLRSLNHRWATPADVARVEWLDRVVEAEQGGATRLDAIRAAGEVPR